MEVGRIRWGRHARCGCSGCWRCGTRTRLDYLQGYVMEHLGDPGGVLVVVRFSSKAKSGGKATVSERFGSIPGL